MPTHTVTAHLACAGNKRKFIQDVFPSIKGLGWSTGAVGHAEWTGVPIRYVLLEHMKLDEASLKGKHLVSMGYDADFQGKHYEVSIPMEIALDPKNEIILAYEQNGEPIPTVHGYPIRLVCPGFIGVRSTKWVHKLFVSDEMADSGPQRRDYKIVKELDMASVEWSHHEPINGQVLNSAIASPVHEAQVSSAEKIVFKGYAYGNGDKGT